MRRRRGLHIVCDHLPPKVNLTLDTVPTGRTLHLDGIAKARPFVYDTLIGFSHTIEARDRTVGSTTYTLQSWSDGGAQQHSITVPSTDQTYTATYSQSTTPGLPPLSRSTPPPLRAHRAASRWLERGCRQRHLRGRQRRPRLSARGRDTHRGTGLSQAIHYAKNISGSGAGANRVTVTFDKAVAYADIRIMEYSGLDQTSPLDVSSSSAGTSSQATSGSATTRFAREPIIGAGMTTGEYTSAGTGFTTRIITNPDADIIEDRNVTATGSYSATATQTAIWLMQMVTFKAAGQ